VFQDDIIYSFPSQEEPLTAVRGLFLTLSSSLRDAVQAGAEWYENIRVHFFHVIPLNSPSSHPSQPPPFACDCGVFLLVGEDRMSNKRCWKLKS
jgi:hypothetical protein